ncbi:MAG: hypothetical protein M0R50_08395 [Candidatus Cloacimonetes bacterium]|jgi:hypothetical protein|nr:hypothetical protein [Candidatus Cloacimonadota bacterium]
MQLSNMISEDVNETLVNVDGFGRMTKQQAMQTTVTYLRQMAEALEQGVNIPTNYFDLAKSHYIAAIS